MAVRCSVVYLFRYCTNFSIASRQIGGLVKLGKTVVAVQIDCGAVRIAALRPIEGGLRYASQFLEINLG